MLHCIISFQDFTTEVDYRHLLWIIDNYEATTEWGGTFKLCHMALHQKLSVVFCGKIHHKISVAKSFIQCSGLKLDCIHVILKADGYNPTRWSFAWTGEIPLHGNVPQENECLPYSTFVMILGIHWGRVHNAMLEDLTQALKYCFGWKTRISTFQIYVNPRRLNFCLLVH